MTAIVALVNQKGGVGKTSVTLGLTSAARAAGHRVLVVDLDPQASATWVLGVDPLGVERSTSDLLHKGKTGSAERAVTASGWGELVDVVPAGPGLQDYESGDGKHPAGRLRSALDGATGRYDLVLVDCAPSLGNLTLNALTAATHAVVVVEPAALSLRGVGAVADVIDQVWADHNSELDLAGVIVNKVPAVSSEADRRYDELTRIVGKKAVWRPVVPARVVVNQATADRRPIHAYGHRATEVIDAFDQLYAKLRRVTRKF